MSQILYTYQLFGLIIRSDYRLAHIPPISFQGREDALIRCSDRPLDLRYAIPETKSYYSLSHYEKNEAHIHYMEHGTFIIKEGRRITCYLKKHHNNTAVTQILLCSCMGVLLAQKGMLALHGSLTFLQGNALIISGDSGAGKSSITARLLSEGARFMADDMACITFSESQPWGQPGFPICKLHQDMIEYFQLDKEKAFPLPDNKREKYGLPMDKVFHNKPEPIGAMVFIRTTETERLSISQISGSSKLTLFIHSLYRKELYQATGFGQELLQKSIAFCNQVPMYQLLRPLQGVDPQEPAKLIRTLF